MLVVEAPHGEVRGRDAAVTVAEAHGEVPGRAADIGLKLVEVPSGEVLDPHGEVPGRAADGGLKLPMEVPHGEVPGRGAVSLAARTSALMPYDMAKKKAETDSAKVGAPWWRGTINSKRRGFLAKEWHLRINTCLHQTYTSLNPVGTEPKSSAP